MLTLNGGVGCGGMGVGGGVLKTQIQNITDRCVRGLIQVMGFGA